jgi:hypothetical protein
MRGDAQYPDLLSMIEAAPPIITVKGDLSLHLINFFFIEFKEDQEEDVIEINNTLYFKGTESITPGIIIKTTLAINYLKNNYEYDFLFRTNLSTLININNLCKYINTLPQDNICSGFDVDGFITGTGIIMPKHVAELIADNYINFNYMYMFEDVLISRMFNYYNIAYIVPINYEWGLIHDFDDTNPNKPLHKNYNTENKYKPFIFSDNTLHYRIKNGNRYIDFIYFKELIKIIYDVNVDIEVDVNVDIK